MLDCLIIDDEISIVKAVCEYFNLFNVSCEYAVDFETGLQTAYDKEPSLILLDVNLDGKSGYALCKTLRETTEVPILFISARNTDDDVLMALGAGGDDYITKPFSMAVLLAKAKAMLKRSVKAGTGAGDNAGEAISISAVTKKMIHFGSIEIERNSARVLKNGEPVKLKPMEWKLLIYLYDNRGRRISKDELLKNVWEDTFIGEGTLSVHVRHLREKLEDDPGNPCFIKTMWGSGYMFEEQE